MGQEWIKVKEIKADEGDKDKEVFSIIMIWTNFLSVIRNSNLFMVLVKLV
jgi:hypothetical protein